MNIAMNIVNFQYEDTGIEGHVQLYTQIIYMYMYIYIHNYNSIYMYIYTYIYIYL